MKTKPTTTARSSKASPAAHSVDSEVGKHGHLGAKRSKQPNAYPDLGEFIPDDYTTTHDVPEYGRGPRSKEE